MVSMSSGNKYCSNELLSWVLVYLRISSVYNRNSTIVALSDGDSSVCICKRSPNGIFDSLTLHNRLLITVATDIAVIFFSRFHWNIRLEDITKSYSSSCGVSP